VQKLIATWLVRSSQSYMECEGSLPCTDEITSGSYPEPTESSLDIHTLKSLPTVCRVVMLCSSSKAGRLGVNIKRNKKAEEAGGKPGCPRTTWRYNQDGRSLHSCCRDNLKSNILTILNPVFCSLQAVSHSLQRAVHAIVPVHAQKDHCVTA
jgi:hypothetical protein